MANKRISELSSRVPSASDLMLIGDPTTGYSYKCTLLETIGLGVPATRTITINGTTFDLSANRTWNVGTVTSVGLSMPPAFSVSGSPVTNNGTLTVTAAGTSSQYIRGDGQLADFPEGGGGGGASVSYYLNGSVSQGTFGGTTYYEVNKTPILGAGTNFSINTNGYIASFITDAGDPGQLLIPGGNWNFEVFFAASSGGGTPTYYVELYKYDGTTFSLIASNATNPDVITGGTSVEAYFSTLAVPETVLTITDRLAIRVYVTPAGRTITLHTEDNNLCQIITTFTTGITALNGLTKQVQYFATGTTGTNFNIVSSNDTHTFNLPSSSALNRGLLTAADWTAFNGKQNALNGTGFVRMAGTTVSYITGTSSQFIKADGTLDSSVYVTSNIYTADGTLTGNRTISLSTFSLTIAQNQNANTNLNFTNLTSGTFASVGIQFNTNAGNNSGAIFKYSTGSNAFKNITAGSLGIYNDFSGDIALLNNLSTGRITFAAGGAGTAQMTLFSNGNIGINTTTDAGFRLDVNGTMRVQGAALDFGTTSTSSTMQRIFSSNRSDFRMFSGGNSSDYFSMYFFGGAYGSNYVQIGVNDGVASGSQGGAIYMDSRTGIANPIRFLVKGTGTTAMTEAMSVTNTGNFAIGTTTDAGFRLDVNGTSRFTSTATITQTANLSSLVLDGTKTITTSTQGGNAYFSINPTIADNNTGNNTFYRFLTIAPTITHTVAINSSGNYALNIAPSFTASGTNIDVSNNTFVNIAPSYSGQRNISTTRGIYINPTFTSIAGTNNFIAIETVFGNVLFNTTSGNLGIGTTSPTYKLHVVGTSRITGNTEFSTASGAYMIVGATGDTSYRLSVDGDLRVYGNIRTAQPTGGTGVGVWRLGSTATGTYTMSTTVCVEIEIGGTLYKLATVS